MCQCTRSLMTRLACASARASSMYTPYVDHAPLFVYTPTSQQIAGSWRMTWWSSYGRMRTRAALMVSKICTAYSTNIDHTILAGTPFVSLQISLWSCLAWF